MLMFTTHLQMRVPLLTLSTYCTVELIGRVYLALNLLILLNGKFLTHKMVQSFYWNLNCNLLCSQTIDNMTILLTKTQNCIAILSQVLLSFLS